MIEAKTALGHGYFLKWIETEFEMSDRTARSFIHATECFGSKSEIVSGLAPTVLYALAAPSTPDEVREAVLDKAASGEKITSTDVNRWRFTFTYFFPRLLLEAI